MKHSHLSSFKKPFFASSQSPCFCTINHHRLHHCFIDLPFDCNRHPSVTQQALLSVYTTFSMWLRFWHPLYVHLWHKYDNDVDDDDDDSWCKISALAADCVYNINCYFVLLCLPYREEAFKKNMWEKMSSYFFENIYIPAAQADNTGYRLNISQCLLHVDVK